MCQAFRWSSLLVTWGMISFGASLIVIGFGALRALHRERAEYQQLLEVVACEHARETLNHMEVMN